MQRREVLGNGQVEVSREMHADRIEFRISVYRAPTVAAAEPDVLADWYAPPDPAFEWAERRLFGHVVGLIKADLAVLPHELDEDYFLDPETGEIVEECKAAHALHLLENTDREQITDRLRSPSVMRIIDKIRAGKIRRPSVVCKRFYIATACRGQGLR